MAAKERESKKLKELSEKQEKVKAHRDMYAVNKNRIVVGKRPVGTEELTQPRIQELKSWVHSEVESQIVRNDSQEEMQRQIELRMKASKRLQILRQQNNSAGRMHQISGAVSNALSQLDALGIPGALPVDNSSSLTQTESESNSNDPRDVEIKALEEELRKRSKTIAWHQGHIADLGAVVEKRRFAQITDLKEAKLIMGILFDMVTREKHFHVKSLESRLSSHESTIDSLKKQLATFSAIECSDGNNILTSAAAHSKPAVPRSIANTAKVRLPLHAPKSGFEGILREVKSTKALSNQVAATKKDIDGKSKRRDSNEEEEEYIDEMDESFYPSEQESDEDYDSDFDGSSKRNKRKGGAARSKRTGITAGQSKKFRTSESDNSASNDSFGSSSGCECDAPMSIIPIDRPLAK